MMAKITQLRAASKCHIVEFTTLRRQLLMYNEGFVGYASIEIMMMNKSLMMLIMAMTLLLINL